MLKDDIVILYDNKKNDLVNPITYGKVNVCFELGNNVKSGVYEVIGEDGIVYDIHYPTRKKDSVGALTRREYVRTLEELKHECFNEKYRARAKEKDRMKIKEIEKACDEKVDIYLAAINKVFKDFCHDYTEWELVTYPAGRAVSEEDGEYCTYYDQYWGHQCKVCGQYQSIKLHGDYAYRINNSWPQSLKQHVRKINREKEKKTSR